MTKSILATLYQRVGEPQTALRFFEAGHDSYQRPPFGVFDETLSNHHPHFATGAGGILQSLIYGFGGLEITDGGRAHRPGKLPQRWKSLTITGVGPERQTFSVKGGNRDRLRPACARCAMGSSGVDPREAGSAAARRAHRHHGPRKWPRAARTVVR